MHVNNLWLMVQTCFKLTFKDEYGIEHGYKYLNEVLYVKLIILIDEYDSNGIICVKSKDDDKSLNCSEICRHLLKNSVQIVQIVF